VKMSKLEFYLNGHGFVIISVISNDTS